MEGLVAASIAGSVLLALWVGATRRHARRDAAARAEWEEATIAPRLWTAPSPCPDCRADGGVLSTEDGEVWFTCLACGQRRRRQTQA